jgi:hypothetical protein
MIGLIFMLLAKRCPSNSEYTPPSPPCSLGGAASRWDSYGPA